MRQGQHGSEYDRTRIRQLLHLNDPKLTLQQIADRMGCSTFTVFKIRQEERIKCQKSQKLIKQNPI